MGETIDIPQKDGTAKTLTKGEFLSGKLFQLAASGDLGAIKLCLDNVDGPPVQTIESITIDPRPPLTVEAAREAARAHLKADEEAGEV
jgi:hypothetical protein